MKKGTVAVLLSITLILTFTVALGCGGGGEEADTGKPVINTIDPEAGPRGTIVQVMGKSFGETQGNSVVHVGNKVAEDVLAWSDQSIAVRIPGNVNIAMQGISVLTTDGESNQLNFDVTKSDETPTPKPNENEVENPTPASAMLDYLKKKGINTSGWTFSVVKVSTKDPNWKIDKATKTNQATQYFLLRKEANGNWTVVYNGTAFTPDEMKGAGAPDDLWLQMPSPEPQPKSQQEVIFEYMNSKNINTTNASVYTYKQSRTDPAWELFYIDFPPEQQQTDLIFALHQENGQWVVKGYGSGPEVYNTPGLPDDLKAQQSQ
ncbi:MAG: IPT/TIG domain-containing protein [Actinobacteria bacterium]|nr:IPT/TIG domain-containing protein [Actinomycetota bacterium]